VIAVAALAVYLAWLVLAFGLRSLIQARRTGDAGWRPPGGQRGSLQWWSRTIVGFGAVAAGLAAPIADLTGLPTITILDRAWRSSASNSKSAWSKRPHLRRAQGQDYERYAAQVGQYSICMPSPMTSSNGSPSGSPKVSWAISTLRCRARRSPITLPPYP